MDYLRILLCLSIVASMVLLSITLYRLNNKSNKPIATLAQMDASGQCVETAGYNPYDAPCCQGLTAFSGPGGDYCLQKGGPNCNMMCQYEACEQGEGGVDPTCAAKCSQVC